MRYEDCPQWVKDKLPKTHPKDEYGGNGFRTVYFTEDTVEDHWHHSSASLFYRKN